LVWPKWPAQSVGLGSNPTQPNPSPSLSRRTHGHGRPRSPLGDAAAASICLDRCRTHLPPPLAGAAPPPARPSTPPNLPRQDAPFQRGSCPRLTLVASYSGRRRPIPVPTPTGGTPPWYPPPAPADSTPTSAHARPCPRLTLALVVTSVAGRHRRCRVHTT
jgi:hypothetical protein